MAWVILAILVIAAFALIGIYNSLVQLRVRTDTAWSDIDVQLKRRHELIPNLVAMQATTPADKAAAENQLSSALKSLFAVAENYPQLQASQEFTQLQNSLTQTEDSIQYSRNGYNAAVRDLNATVQSFPSNILAGMFGFQQRQYFEAAAVDREPVEVKF
jgi:LemA protein